MTTIADLLTEWKLAAGDVSDAALAAEVSRHGRRVTQTAMSNWKRGVTVPSPEYADALAKALTVGLGRRVSLDEIVATMHRSRLGKREALGALQDQVVEMAATLRVLVERVDSLTRRVESRAP